MPEQLHRVLKALADPNRMRIMNILSEKPLCVCEIEAVLGISQSNASRHLKVLKDASLIESRKDAQFVEHIVNPSALKKFTFLKPLLTAYAEYAEARADLEKLERLKLSDGLRCSL